MTTPALGLALLVGAFDLASAGENGMVSPARPNILFILADDHGVGSIGAYGDSMVATPNIDRIAQEGAILLNNTTAYALCGPSRASIITGQHASRHGVTANQVPFDASQWTFPQALQKAGYRTALFGKWHLHSKPEGYETMMVNGNYAGQGNYYNPFFTDEEGENTTIHGHSTEIIADLTIDWLKAAKKNEEPFFVSVHFKAPHGRWEPSPDTLGLLSDQPLPEPPDLIDTALDPESALARFPNRPRMANLEDHVHLFLGESVENPVYFPPGMTEDQKAAWVAAYAAENVQCLTDPPASEEERIRWNYQRMVKNYLRTVAEVDRQVGRILQELERLGLAQDTLVIYAGDHGFHLGEKGLHSKSWAYERSLLMPCLMRWPGRIQPETRIEALTQNIDFAPTLLEAAGLPVPDSVQGRSWLPLLADQAPPDWRTALYYGYLKDYGAPRHEAVRTLDWKLIRFPDLGITDMYHLTEDPAENRNLANDPNHAAQRKNLEQELARLRLETGHDAFFSSDHYPQE